MERTLFANRLEHYIAGKISAVIFHVIYGLHLGLICNPYDEDKVGDL